MIAIGTSGFDYKDWRGPFYPETMPHESWLGYYARRFGVLELNFSYYRFPAAGQLASMVERTGGRVEFAIKAHRSMTHDRCATEAETRAFLSSVAELREADRLGAVLAQFPNSFRQCEQNRGYLKRLADRLGPPLVVELRHGDWAADPILSWLERLGVGFCCVDEPPIDGLMPHRAVATASPAYVRFHGRNARKWYSHDRPEERYDYRYEPAELAEWSKRLRNLERKAGKVLVFFNNHFQAKAVESAEIMERLLERAPA
jgi:uncharacterized protein YecE (DUF72 family)